MDMERLYQKLQEYTQSDMYGFHMPGHKRKPVLKHCYEIDITEIDGFDDMHHPEGILKEFQIYMSHVYGSRKSYFLINGSTGGILSAISAVTELEGEILIARNCHKSVYHTAYLRNLKTHYIYPQYDENWGIFTTILPWDVEKAMEKYPKCKVVMIVSPTYEGVVSDINAIAKVVHEHGGILIVDEAHGAHFSFLEDFPKSAVDCGADIVIQSVHKTLPSLTQTALLHVCSGEKLQQKVEQYLSIYQTSSPSYVFLSAIEECVLWMEENKENEGKAYAQRIARLRRCIVSCKRIELYEYDARYQRRRSFGFDAKHQSAQFVKSTEQTAYDQGKLVLRVRNMENSGRWLYDTLLARFHIQLEMCMPGYCIAMTSIMDDEEALNRLLYALMQIDKELVHDCLDENQKIGQNEGIHLRKALENEFVLTSYGIDQCDIESLFLEDCIGRISAETAYVYPPGIPVIVAGERFSEGCVQVLKQYCRYGFEIRGIRDHRIYESPFRTNGTDKDPTVKISVVREGSLQDKDSQQI